ncbi:phosphotransferase [Virgibacillus litoralis]|uniref:Spore coat protein YsxE n=1 Tax=Virgibacillus litoralis TaxID=578221 RepID=A0ABS4HAK4_9BACI|nr:spore coat protein YsxE [Virgibacillus litoralis]
MNEVIHKIAEQYGIHPYKIEQVSERLFRISDGKHLYALKQSNLTESNLAFWEYIYHQAYSQNIQSILPVYLTKQSKLYAINNQSYYYLTPWLSSNKLDQQQVIRNLYNAIGEIHVKTKRTQFVQTDTLISTFTDYQKNSAELYKKELYFVELFEKNRFMSPFELLVCTQFRIMDNVLTVLNNCIDLFISQIQNDKEWNYSLCHGNLNLEHILHHNDTYILNWEKATYDNAIMDLSILLKQLVRNYDQSSSQLTDSFSAYTNHNKLKKSELYLLAIYLLNPYPYIKKIQDYIDNPSNDTMINQVKDLQFTSRQLLFGLKWFEFVEKEKSVKDNNKEN